ncbi:hypothetical protein M0805_002085 [Coniferiporia weirii]|nr:hypothetical protein M0805_002085 [Coniferiporia weirii]
MKFTTIAASLLFFSGAALATERAGYDTTYDNASGSMDTVSCSDGPEGLASRYPTFGDVPTFPNIGGAAAIAGWGSASCGTCWRLTYQGASIVVVAIDHADDGFNLSEEALNTLTDGNAVFDGAVQVTAEQVDASECGL